MVQSGDGAAVVLEPSEDEEAEVRAFIAELEARTATSGAGGLFGAVAALLERLCADVGRRLPPGAAEGLLLLEGLLRGTLQALLPLLCPEDVGGHHRVCCRTRVASSVCDVVCLLLCLSSWLTVDN